MKYFGNVRESITEALEQYKNEVLNDIYPNIEHSYDYVGEQLEDLKEWVENNDLNKEAAELSKTNKKPMPNRVKRLKTKIEILIRYHSDLEKVNYGKMLAYKL